MKRRVADILLDELSRIGVGHIFTLSGGGIMYLLDALGRSDIMHICCHHEQSASIAAQANAMHKNTLGVCLVTTGPGGTNALTGCAAAYMDSTPVLFISGQVKMSDLASKRGVRQFGSQENDIVSMAAPVCKFAVPVEEPEHALFTLQKAIFLATHGRRGPVWVDIPLDVQFAEVEEDNLPHFDPARDFVPTQDHSIAAQLYPGMHKIDRAVKTTLRLLNSAHRPLILLGHGVVAAGAQEIVRVLARRLGIPVQSTWRGLGIMGNDDELFFGSPGLQAVRSSNLIAQGADFLLVLGSRLDNMITAFDEQRFAFRAQKVIVDTDAAEITKLTIPDITPVVCDAGLFIQHLIDALPKTPANDFAPWLDFCRQLKNRYPLLKEQQPTPCSGVDLYRLTDAISSTCRKEDVIVVSSTSRCNTAGHMAFAYRQGQSPISSMGMGSMGFALPSVVGAWFASGGSRVILLEGDGSFQLNLQELQTIRHYGINAKLFVFSNGGYASIATMQDKNFDGFHVGSDSLSGVTFPELEKVAASYDIHYLRIDNDATIMEDVARVLGIDGPVLCEVKGDIRFDDIPKCVSSLNAEGKRVSAALENPFPFLDESDIKAIYSRLPE